MTANSVSEYIASVGGLCGAWLHRRAEARRAARHQLLVESRNHRTTNFKPFKSRPAQKPGWRDRIARLAIKPNDLGGYPGRRTPKAPTRTPTPREMFHDLVAAYLVRRREYQTQKPGVPPVRAWRFFGGTRGAGHGYATTKSEFRHALKQTFGLSTSRGFIVTAA
jgi:hypothetical protein